MVPEFSVQKHNGKYTVGNYVAVVLAILESVRMVGFISLEPNYIILLGLMLIPVAQSLFGTKTVINPTYILFCIYLCFNIVITDPPPVFNTGQRLLLFIVLLSSVSSMISSEVQRYFRLRCFYIFISIMSALSAASCICYFLGINFFRSFYGLTDYTVHAGLFGGLFAQSMFLGPMAGISVCFLIWNYLITKRKTFIIFAVLSGGAMLFSASRSAVLSTICACIILIILFYKKKGNALKFLTGAALLMTVTFPLWESSLSGISEKNDNNEKLGKYGSRTEKFEARLAEFGSNPVFGVGFASVDPNGKDIYNTVKGTIEPGSSWLSTLSMTGIIGSIFVAYFVINAFKNAKRSTAVSASLMASLVVWFALHMIFEGYIFAAGGPMCFITWLILGTASDLKYLKNS